MPWKVKDVLEQRVEFVMRVQGGEKLATVCREYGISRPTGYLWLRRYDEAGSVTALEDRSRRPKHSPHRTAVEIEEKVLTLWKKFGWGARKTHHLLLQQGIPLSLITVRRMYERLGLVTQRNVTGPAPLRFERASPNELWQMDHKGQIMTDDNSWCYPLSMIDDHSRFCIGLHAQAGQTIRETKRSIVKTFETYGIPAEMLMDHGTPWWNSSNGWGLTQLSVSLINQGIKLRFGRVRHPQTQGKVERFNQTLKVALSRYRGKLSSLSACGTILTEIQSAYNFVRPHESLDMNTPAQRYRRSKKEYNPTPLAWDYPSGAQVVTVDSLGRISYEQRRFFVCEALPGQSVQIIPLEQSALVVYRDMVVRELDCDTGASISTAFPLKDALLD